MNYTFHKRIVLPCAFIMGAMTTMTMAHAGVIIEYTPSLPAQTYSQSSAPAPTDSVAKKNSVITAIGRAPDAIAKISVVMKNVYLLAAVKKIVPEGWRALADDMSIKDVGRVDVTGINRPWLEILESAIEPHGVVVTVDWGQKELIFSAAKPR